MITAFNRILEFCDTDDAGRPPDPADIACVSAALSDYWAVRVLDAWARHVGLGHWDCRHGCDGDQSDRWILWVSREATDDDESSGVGYIDGDIWARDFDRKTPEAARLFAAETLYTELPKSLQATLVR